MPDGVPQTVPTPFQLVGTSHDHLGPTICSVLIRINIEHLNEAEDATFHPRFNAHTTPSSLGSCQCNR